MGLEPTQALTPGRLAWLFARAKTLRAFAVGGLYCRHIARALGPNTKPTGFADR